MTSFKIAYYDISAAKAAMRFLQNGGSAVDAVEMAIKVLEDKEITNAGYGSNLGIEGHVECDATMVDHFGRSGAVGAISRMLQSGLQDSHADDNLEVANPIHVARLVLDQATRPLSLRRVPPNLLVGQGATDFAFECRVPLLPHDALISQAAKERYNRWKQDLARANNRGETDTESEFSEDEYGSRHSPVRANSTKHRLSGLRNEAQPYSPLLTPLSSPHNRHGDGSASPSTSSPASCSDSGTGQATSRQFIDLHPPLLPQPPFQSRGQIETYAKTPGPDDGQSWGTLLASESEDERSNRSSFIDDQPHFSLSPVVQPLSHATNVKEHQSTASDVSSNIFPVPYRGWKAQAPPLHEDNVTDTVGAIAIDCLGNMAAGSSSGGIGMKHKGRTGPAALVGVGTALLPIVRDDKTNTCVATVMSGTGEHMATTVAANTCANRLYFNVMKGKHGTNIDTDEEGAIRSFVLEDFMSISVESTIYSEADTMNRSSLCTEQSLYGSYWGHGGQEVCRRLVSSFRTQYGILRWCYSSFTRRVTDSFRHSPPCMRTRVNHCA